MNENKKQKEAGRDSGTASSGGKGKPFKADRGKAIGRKYGMPGLKESISTLGSFNVNFMDEPWKDPIRFEYDITILERDMLALCAEKNNDRGKYSWRPGLPRSSYAKKNKNLPQRPQTAGSIDERRTNEFDDGGEEVTMRRTESECILYLAGLGGKPPENFPPLLQHQKMTKEEGTSIDLTELMDDCNGNQVLEEHERATEGRQQGRIATDKASTSEKNNENTGGFNAWFNRLVQSFSSNSEQKENSEGTPPQDNKISAVLNETTELRYVWTQRSDGVWMPQPEISQSTRPEPIITPPSMSENPPQQLITDIALRSEGAQQRLDLNDPAMFPRLSATTTSVMDTQASSQQPPNANGDHTEEERITFPPHSVDYLVASESHRQMLPTTGSPVNFDVSPTPSQMWAALTKQYKGRNPYERAPLKEMLSRSRGKLLPGSRMLHSEDYGKNSEKILQYICGAPTASLATRKVDSSLQVGPADFVDSCLRIHPGHQVESAMRVDFTHFV